MKGAENSCVHHEVILSYLKDYADYFQILKFIKVRHINKLNITLIRFLENMYYSVPHESRKGSTGSY